MWNSNIGNEFMQSADGRRDDNLLAEGVLQGMYSPPARTMRGDKHLRIKEKFRSHTALPRRKLFKRIFYAELY